MGKSRLVTEVRNAAECDGALSLWGTAHGTGFLAFEPWADALRAFFRSAPATLVGAALGDDEDSVARIPWLRDVVPGETIENIGTPTEEAVAKVVGDVLARLAARRELLVVLDDVQWADPASVEVLRRLLAAERGNDAGYLVVAMERRPARETGPWHESLSTGDVSPSGTVELERLDDAGCAELLRELDPGLADAELAGAVYDASGGNAFLVRQLADHVREERQPQIRGNGGDDLAASVPATAAALWGARLEPLSRGARRGLGAAAVIGLEFDRPLLEGLDSDLETEWEVVIDEGIRAGLLEPVVDHDGRYRFRHGLVRDHLYGGLSQVRRRRVHRATAQALERTGAADADAPALAYHYLESGASFRPQALVHTIAAARWNVTQGASDTARGLSERALRLLRELEGAPDVDPARWAHSSLDLGNVLVLLGHPDGQSVLLTAADKFEAFDDVCALADCAGVVLRRGDLVSDESAMDQVVPLVERLVPRLDEVDPIRAAHVLARYSQALDGRGEPIRQRDNSDRALTLARTSGDPDTLAIALNCHRPGGEPHRIDDSLRSARELEALGRRHANLEYLVHGLMWAVNWELDRGDTAAAAEAISEARGIAARVPPGQIATLHNGDLKRNMDLLLLDRSSMHALAVGAYEDVEQLHSELSRRTAEPSQPYPVTAILAIQQGVFADDRGQLGELAPGMEAMVEDRPGVVLVRVFTALACAESEPPNLAGAERYYRPLVDGGLADLEPDGFLVNLLVFLARTAHTLGDEDGARLIGSRLAPYHGRNTAGVLNVCTGPVDWALGLCDTTLGRYHDAEARFVSALDLCRRTGLRPFEARVELAWAEMLARTGGPAQQEHAERAHILAAELGMARVERLARELLPA